MHDTALAIVQKFFELYIRTDRPTIVEIGAMNVNGSPRSICPDGVVYLGLDCAHGPGVDIVVIPDQPLPLRSDFADIVISTSQMEHDSFFWKSFLEFLRILKPGGVLYINAPSNGSFHRYPRDCWRFYPDSGKALEDWSRANCIEATLAESFIANRLRDQWNDFVAVFIKKASLVPEEIGHLADHFETTNVRLYGKDTLDREQATTEDMKIIGSLRAEIAAAEDKIEQLTRELEEARSKLDTFEIQLDAVQRGIIPSPRQGDS